MDIPLLNLLDYALRAGAVVVFWYLARRHLFAAAVVQGFCYPLYGNLMIPVIRHVFAIQMGFVFGGVLLVEALRQRLPRRVLDNNRGAIFVRLVLALFLVSIFSYLMRGAAAYSLPGWHLFERLSNEVLPCCIIALIPGAQKLRQCWRVAFWSVGIPTVAYLLVGLAALIRKVRPAALRRVALLVNYLGAGAGIGIIFVIMSVYFLPWRKGWRPDYRGLLMVALISAGVVVLLSGTRTFAVSLPMVICLCALFPPPQRFGDSRITIIGTLAATALLGSVLLLSSERMQSTVSGQYNYLTQRFQGEYGSVGLSGRTEMWRRAWAMFKEHPLYGGGEHNSGVVRTVYDPKARRTIWFRTHQHSIYLKYLGEQGLIGGILLLIIIANFLVNRLHMSQLGRWPVPTAVIGQGAWVLGITGLAWAVVAGGREFFLAAAFLVAALDAGKAEALQAWRVMRTTPAHRQSQADDGAEDKTRSLG